MKVLSGSNLSMIRGDSESIAIHRTDASKATVPFVDGDILRFTVRQFALDDASVIAKIITEFKDGKAVIALSPADTKDIFPSEYVYDIELTDSAGAVKTIVGPSKFVIQEDVTHGQ